MIPRALSSLAIDGIKKYLKKKAFDKSFTNKSIENDIDKAFDNFEMKFNILLNEMFDDVIGKIEDESIKTYLSSFDKENLVTEVDNEVEDLFNNDIFQMFLNNHIKTNLTLNSLKDDLEIKLLSFKTIFESEKYNYIDGNVKVPLINKEKDKVTATIDSSLLKAESVLGEILVNFLNDFKIYFGTVPNEQKIILDIMILQIEKLFKQQDNKIYYQRTGKIIKELFDEIVGLIA